MGKQENKSMAEIEPRPHSEDSDRRSPSLPGSKQDSNRRSRRWKIRALTHDVVFLPQSHSPSPQSEFDTPGSGASGTDGSQTLPGGKWIRTICIAPRQASLSRAAVPRLGNNSNQLVNWFDGPVNWTGQARKPA